MLALQSWCVGSDGPDTEWMRSQLCSLDAGVVALQAASRLAPRESALDEIKERIKYVESALERMQHTDVELVGAAIRDDLERFSTTLAETSQTMCSLRAELSTKAGHLDTNAALEILEREIVKLNADTVGQQQLQTCLNSKIDRQDLHRMAALIANGELEGLSPFVIAIAFWISVFPPTRFY
mmetsp:Transcript_5206/g.16421  ORF Transcript_5206/g.16421 Transcript_5206/m.16421 type:complete len:182 (+) Transcript_5206:1639-2184(+)